MMFSPSGAAKVGARNQLESANNNMRSFLMPRPRSLWEKSDIYGHRLLFILVDAPISSIPQEEQLYQAQHGFAPVDLSRSH